jgi:putative heme-binding domain-containing protein
MEMFGQFLDMLEPGGLTWLKIRDSSENDALSALLKGAKKLFSEAGDLAADQSEPAGRRVAAASLLARSPDHREEALPLLASLLSPRHPVESQRTAIGALGVTGDPRVPALIAAGWRGLGPDTRSAALDLLLSREPWSFGLCALIADNTIPLASLDAARRSRLLRHSSGRVRESAANALNPPNSQTRAHVVDKFRPALGMEGNARRGLAVFEKLCASCHQAGGRGNDIGPNLVSVANHPSEKLLVSILDPNASIEPGFAAYTLELSGGEELHGIIAAETGNSVVLKLPDGSTRAIPRSGIARVVSSNLSFMPEGLEEGMTETDLADLIRFLQKPDQF